MALKIRRGTEAQRSGVTFAAGELIWTTNGHKLYVGDGITAGGIDIASQFGGSGVVYNQTSGKLDLDLTGKNSDNLSEGTTNQYFTPTRAQAAVATALTNGNPYNTGITFLYDDVDHRITATVTGGDGGTTLPSQSGHPNQYLKTDGSGNLSWATPPEGITAISQDGAPALGANLTLNGHNITGTGNINITGSATATSLVTGNLTFANNTLTVASGAFYIESHDQQFMQIKGVNPDGTLGNTPQVNFFSSRGTVTSPTNSQPGDHVVTLNFGGYHGTAYQQIASIVSGYETGATMTDSNPGSGFGFVTNNNNGGVNIATFNMSGVFAAPTLGAGDGTAVNPSIVFTTDGSQDSGFFHPADGVVCVAINAQEKARFDGGGLRVQGFSKVGSFNGSGVFPSPAEAGMIIFDSNTSHFYGYDGTTWKQLDN